MYLDSEKIEHQLSEVSRTSIGTDSLMGIQKLEDMVREEKLRIARELIAKKNQFNLDSFLDLLSRILGVTKIEAEYYYFVVRKFDYNREISEKRKAFITFIGCVNNLNYSTSVCHTSAILAEVERLMSNNIDFLFLTSDDDSFIADIVKTPNEIILPYGNSIKYVKGENKQEFESGIRLVADVSNALDFPVTLKLRP